MPYVPPKPVAKGIPAITSMGATGGAGQFTAIDNSPAIAALVEQVGNIQYYVSGANGTAQKEAGSMTALMNGQMKQLSNINSTLKQIADKAIEQGATITGAANSITQAIGTLSGVLTEIGVQHAYQVADQINHNEFQETATNTARKEANKGKIEVQQTDYKAKVEKGVKNIGTLQSVAKVAGTVNSLVSNAAGTAVNFAKGWLADTTIGKAVLDRIAKTKTWIAQSEAEAKAKLEAIDKKAKADVAEKSGEPPGP